MMTIKKYKQKLNAEEKAILTAYKTRKLCSIPKLEAEKRRIQNIAIEKHAKEVLKDFKHGEFESVDNLKQELKLARQAASNFMKRD